MAEISRDIFDKYQKTLLNNKYVDLKDTSNIIYEEEEVEVKPLTKEEYEEMGSSFYSSIYTDDKRDSSAGSIETEMLKTSHTFTSFNNTLKSILNDFEETSGDVIGYKYDSSPTVIEQAVINSLGFEATSINVATEALMGALADIVDILPSVTTFTLNIISSGAEFLQKASGAVGNVVGGVVDVVGGVISSGVSMVKTILNPGGNKDIIEAAKSGWNSFADRGVGEGVSKVTSTILDAFIGVGESLTSFVTSGINSYANWLSSTLRTLDDTFDNVYFDGVSETKFGQKMENSWKKFVELELRNDKIRFNSENNPVSLLGTNPILFGTPPRYNTLSDPRDRSYINTFMKDGNIISIIPGKPKYNGLSLGKSINPTESVLSGFRQRVDRQLGDWSDDFKNFLNPDSESNDGLNMTYQTTAQEYAERALEYLKSNGIHEIFNENDKRYYTFEPDYSNYFAYLETLLNTIYVKMGLGETNDNKTELFTFFNNNTGANVDTLLDKFAGKSLGFYFEGNPSVSENVSNDTNDPAGLKSTADSMSDEFQRLNYITGFGVNNVRKIGIASSRVAKITELIGGVFNGNENTPFTNLSSGLGKVGSLLRIPSKVGDKLLNMSRTFLETDYNALTESMLSTNGMKTQFPNLWTDSNYSKSITVDFEFISPYGDPLSIFQYCYVPLCAILALALPKQAEENGYVNPFFLRVDIPGVISSDFAIISNITWIRGGSQNLWTVDRLPRAISVSVTFEDLYTFLAMTKRISYLSANPNYSMFLDSFSGIRTLHSGGNSINSDYWNLLVNRLNSSNNNYGDKLWNSNSVDKSINEYLNTTPSPEQQFFKNYYKRDITWMKQR